MKGLTAIALATEDGALIAGAGTAAWWVMPAAVIGALAFSLRSATKTLALPAGEPPVEAQAGGGADATAPG